MLRAICLLAIASVAVAQADSEAALHFREGRRLLQENQLVEACAALAKSRALEPRTGTLLNLGDCQARLGKAASAHATFLEAKRRATQVHDDRRAAEADRRAAAVASDVARLTLVVTHAVAGTVIRRDGEPVEPDQWNTPQPLDPGPHTFTVDAPGYRGWSRVRVVEDREQGILVVDALDPLVAAAPPPARPDVRDRTLGLGLAVGAGVQRETLLVGARVSGALVVPRGQLRAVGSLGYSEYPDEPADPTLRTTTLSIGLGVDYLWLPDRRFAFGAGLGLGIDYDRVNHQGVDRQNDVGTFWAARVMPVIVRLRGGTLELGLHAQVQLAGDELVINGIAAVDWFVW